jgi:hypothetical protein
VTARAGGVPSSRDTVRALIRAFLLRFFDNEITGGSRDLATSCFWVTAFLAGPLALLPAAQMMQYRMIVLSQGAEALELFSRSDKTFVITIGMIVAGVLSAITWNSLMLDRRDGLVLGILPIRGRDVIVAKLAALAIYIGAIAAAMHAASALLFGLALADGFALWFLLWIPVVHFVSAVSACALVFLSVTAVQGLALAVAGPVVFRRISPLLQVALVAAVIVAFTKIPLVVDGVLAARGASAAFPAWLLNAPPVWFLGLYECLLGRGDPVLWLLARRALGALAGMTLLTLASYALTYRRVMVGSIQTPEAAGGAWRVAAAMDGLTRLIARRRPTRAAAQFFFASIGRVERLRFIAAVTAGIVLAVEGPAVALLVSGPEPPSARAVNGLAFGALILVLLGLRVAVSVPADPRASWIVPMVDASRHALRSGVWRAVFTVGVVPVVAVFAGLHAWLWGARPALLFVLVHLAAGGLLVELLLWRFEDMPNVRPWRPEGANLRFWWPLYLFGFTSFAGASAHLETLAAASITGSAALAATFVMIAIGLRVSHHRPHAVDVADFDEPVASPQLLKLD